MPIVFPPIAVLPSPPPAVVVASLLLLRPIRQSAQQTTKHTVLKTAVSTGVKKRYHPTFAK